MKVLVDNYSLEYTLYPSFTLTMFKRIDKNYYTKLYGYSRGLLLRQENNNLYIDNIVSEDYLHDITGLWYSPHKYVNDVSYRYRDFAEKLVEYASCIRISVSRQDYKIIFLSTFLSRNTDYYTNVIKWVQNICEKSNDLSNIDRNIILSVGRSYQLIQLCEVLDKVLNIQLLSDFWDVRRVLLSIKYVGPKVVDAFLIFTKSTTQIAPTDVHYTRFIERFRLFENFVYPQKEYCRKYICEDCPRSNRCLTGLSYKHFGRLASWIQTVSYVVDREFCRKNSCDRCLINKICTRSSQ